MNQVYTVTQVNSYIKNMFVRDYVLNNIYLKGEVSNCKYHTSGHIYFTLKDDKGQMACVMFAGQRSGLKFQLKEGQSIIALGQISVYERDGKYQLYAKEIVLDGSGILYQKYEQLRAELEQEGLFDPSIKKTLPLFPKKIGIVTARTGAALQDMINISTRRNPYVQLILYPAQVQGDGAAVTIAAGIKRLDSMGVDIIIAGRGGGSIEDLWAFNEEVVARAIYHCKTPVISAVGHETDVTIADFVADLRAPTPSAAAELAVPDIRGIFYELENMNRSLNRNMERQMNLARNELKQLLMRLEYASPIYQVRQKRQQLIDIEQNLNRFLKQTITRKRHSMEIYAEKLDGLSPLKKLSKGYSFVLNQENKVINRLEKTAIGEQINISVTDGDIKATVNEIVKKDRT
ncbi:exodeoxyribonuclease 7 large subunit [Anaerocolumna cellulosilytica]|uniref:Exodeoxyribonuclease 7 large subunit n=1 Tax=Anaerocolumna cellulosilytica TaxID=433286 RepID=A0A6S6R8T3_9FIRM|nr:exodeoxyribonuclease VII large subunit [Anaerocolumna cellulosilytica]MBB5196612.1 exodeoxyribonuclease VII large subunit [Anaerocolumna cellulosilytica]BCJ95712.1 exodeoxyribonuclease 7 large subunit [Anaerocolumna cellulosilytica]